MCVERVVHLYVHIWARVTYVCRDLLSTGIFLSLHVILFWFWDYNYSIPPSLSSLGALLTFHQIHCLWFLFSLIRPISQWPNWARLATTEPWWSVLLQCRGAWVPDFSHHPMAGFFSCRCMELNSDPHACVASTQLTEPSCQPKFCFFCVCFFVVVIVVILVLTLTKRSTSWLPFKKKIFS